MNEWWSKLSRSSKTSRWTRWGLVIVAILLLFIVFWKIPSWQVTNSGVTEFDKKANLENEYRKTMAQILGGFALLGGFYFTWRGLRASEQQQITERFSRAVGQLGDERSAIRIGAIYSLERIARDSRQDYWPVIELLCAFIRGDARQTEPQTGSIEEPIQPPPDIRAALTVLRRRAFSNEDPERDTIDLSGAQLVGVELRDIHLERALLMDANLEHAYLQSSFLTGARLLRARLDEARLRSAKLEGAVLKNAQLQRAVLRRALLRKADLEGVNLREARLPEANLESANLSSAVLAGADLRRANLAGAVFTGADLRGADLTGAHGLTSDQLSQAIVDETTKLPG